MNKIEEELQIYQSSLKMDIKPLPNFTSADILNEEKEDDRYIRNNLIILFIKVILFCLLMNWIFK